jgi:DNA-binding transcriptional LysR family regulator
VWYTGRIISIVRAHYRRRASLFAAQMARAVMNVVFLGYYCAVVEEGNISAAAKRVYVSEQALSNAMIKLETDLGVKLFERSRKIKPTVIGEGVYRYAKEILDKQDQMYREVELYKNKKADVITIGASPVRAQYFFPKMFEIMHKEFPNLEIRMIERLNSEILESSIITGEIDFSLCQSIIHSPELSYSSLYDERLYLVIPNRFLETSPDLNVNATNDKIGSISCITLIDQLSKHLFILPKEKNRVRQVFDRCLKKHALRLSNVLEVESFETLLSFAFNGQCVTICPEFILRLQVEEISEDQMQKTLFFAINDDLAVTKQVLTYRKGRVLIMDERKIIKIIKEIYHSTFLRIRNTKWKDDSCRSITSTT